MIWRVAQRPAIALLLLAMLLGGCSPENRSLFFPDNQLYPGGIPPHQRTGVVSMGPTYAFRFAEKWRISHAWIEGVNIRPCSYRGNVFRRIPGYPALAEEVEGPMFERGGTIYSGTTFEKNPKQIVFFELAYHIIGEMPNGFQPTGYKPFCGQFFPASRNGLVLWIVKPDPAKGTDAWIDGAVPVKHNGLTWLLKTVPPKLLGERDPQAQSIEYWTLKIPDTSYWLHMRFSGSVNSLEKSRAEHEHLLGLFHQVVKSVKLEPITPVDSASFPPFILY